MPFAPSSINPAFDFRKEQGRILGLVKEGRRFKRIKKETRIVHRPFAEREVVQESARLQGELVK